MTDEEKKAIDKVKVDMSKPLACKEITICDVDDLIKIINLIQKQEKVIDEMADKLSEYTCWNKDNLDMNKLAPIEEIKQYFIRKVE